MWGIRVFSIAIVGLLLIAVSSQEVSAQTKETLLWQEIRNSTSAADYDAYLTAYPDGAYVPLAMARIKALQETTGDISIGSEFEGEATHWEAIKNEGNIEDYRSYLQDYPSGEFANSARAAIERIRRQEDELIESNQANQALQERAPYTVSLARLPQVGDELSNANIDKALMRYYNDKIGGLWKIEQVRSMVVSGMTQDTIRLKVRVTIVSGDHWNHTKGKTFEVELEKFGSKYSVVNVKE